MKATKTTLIVGLLAMMFLALGCKKEKTEEQIKTDISTSVVDMLRFSTSDELFVYLENAEANNKEEGFVSYGKMADDVYYSINPEEMFSSMDEVIDYVLEHRDLFQLILGSDGEYTIETRMYNHPFRNVANTDGIFQVGDTLFRIIENGYAYTSLEHEEELIRFIDKGYRKNTPEIKFYTFGEEYETEDNNKTSHPHHCEDQELENENTIGNNRITLKIRNDVLGPIEPHNYKPGYYYYAKPYHRSIGWWGCNRTITANVDRVLLGYGGVFVFTQEAPTVSNIIHSGNHFDFSKYIDHYVDHNLFTIYSCNCSASTPDAGTVYVTCHL